jgi:hypothetical protein
MDAPQEDYETEEDYCRNVIDEIQAARVILRTKQMEWEAINKIEEKELESRLRKEEMEKATEIEKQKEEARDKRFLQMFQQQQQANVDNTQLIIAAIPAAATPTVTVNAAGVSQATRLPQRQIRHFKGDILEWT